MPENSFPKVDGDIFFASEANGFFPKIIGIIEQDLKLNVSGTDYQTIGGSILYSGTATQITQIRHYMKAECVAQKISSTAEDHNVRMRISGTAGLDIPTREIIVSAVTQVMPINHLFTSGNITASGGNIGSEYSITVEAKSQDNNPNFTVHDFVITGW